MISAALLALTLCVPDAELPRYPGLPAPAICRLCHAAAQDDLAAIDAALVVTGGYQHARLADLRVEAVRLEAIW